MKRRVHRWATLLGKLFAERVEDHFEWGRNDCGLFAADCILTITGFDPAEEYRGKYKSEHGFLRVFKDVRLEELADRWFPRLPTAGAALSGDVGLVVVKETGREAFVVCGGNGSWYGPAERGLAAYPQSEVIVAWGVGR